MIFFNRCVGNTMQASLGSLVYMYIICTTNLHGWLHALLGQQRGCGEDSDGEHILPWRGRTQSQEWKLLVVRQPLHMKKKTVQYYILIVHVLYKRACLLAPNLSSIIIATFYTTGNCNLLCNIRVQAGLTHLLL